MAERSMSYSDYYKNNSDTPKENNDPNLNIDSSNSPQDIIKKRRAALQRRLKMKKVKV